jgi:hypothetical protein
VIYMVIQKTEIVDLSRIEPYIIREGDIFGLGFPGNQWVVMRCVARQKEQWYLYDPIAEGMLSGPIEPSNTVDGITNHTFIKPSKPSSSYANGKPFFVFDVSPPYMYQLFFGVSPSSLRILFSQPDNTDQLGLKIQSANSTYNQFGTILGDDNPINSPGPDSEIIVLPSLDFALGFINDLPISVSPLIKFRVNTIQYQAVTDSSTVYNFLNTTNKTHKKIVGGTTSFNYDISKYLSVKPVQIGMTQSQMKEVLGGT